jgi:hypothetical protein
VLRSGTLKEAVVSLRIRTGISLWLTSGNLTARASRTAQRSCQRPVAWAGREFICPHLPRGDTSRRRRCSGGSGAWRQGQSVSGPGTKAPSLGVPRLCQLRRGRLAAGPLEQTGRTVRLSTFPHPRASTAIQWMACAFTRCVHRSLHRDHADQLRGWRDRRKLSPTPWDRCERGGFMARGLGRIPAIRGALTQARGKPGNDLPAGRDALAPGPAGHPVERTSGQGTGTGFPPGRRSPGLAPGALGWPWHPRQLATARHQRRGAV